MRKSQVKIVFTFFFISTLISNKTFSADNSISLQQSEDSLRYYFEHLAIERGDLKKEEINQKILILFRESLNEEEAFDYPFSSLKHAGFVVSSDEKVRIITWNLPYNDRTHKYFGFIQYKKNKRKVLTYELNDVSDEIENPELAILDHDHWYGALYYSIIVTKYKGSTFYTLLGADLNTLVTKKKIIEILTFNKKDQPVLGMNIIKNTARPIARMIFEYNAQANMTLNFDENLQMIIYDHLSPSRPSLVGQFEFYGPDFSYDALKFERGIWNSYQDIDVRNYNIE